MTDETRDHLPEPTKMVPESTDHIDAPVDDLSAPTDHGTEPTDRPEVAEARKYRKRAQDAEAERDRLHGRVEVLQRSELARILADANLHKAVDLTEVFPDLTGLRTDDGDLDADAITAAIDQLRTERPYLFEQKPTGHLGRFQGAHDEFPTSTTTWQDALRP